MIRFVVRSLCLALIAAFVGLMPTVMPAAHADPPTEILPGDNPVMPLKNQARIVVSKWGLRFQAGQQNSRITITPHGDGLKYVDRGTKSWRDLARPCRALKVDRGVAAYCRIPAKFRDGRMFLEVWPRLGNDHVDGSALSDRFRLWVLTDAGDDRVRGGAGDDFVNGAQGNDLANGGPGNDWLRGGIGTDRLEGDDGGDKIVGADDRDEVLGGDGDDQLYGAAGADTIWAGPGSDSANCGPGGDDSAFLDHADRVIDCESVKRD
jgi:serralysin